MAKTIYTYLHTDDLNGSRIITMDNCSCKLFNIRRSDSDFMQMCKFELEKPALYILLNREKQKAYIGETDAFLTRLSQHTVRKSFWNEAYAFISTDDSLSKTEVQYLESLAYGKAKQMNSFDLSENTIVPKAPHMSLIQRSKTEEFFKYIQFLTKFSGCDIFESRRIKVEKKQVTKESNKPTRTNISSGFVDITIENIKGRKAIILNGKTTYKARLGGSVVREYLKEHPHTSINSLKRIFNNTFLGEWADSNFIEEDIKYAKSIKKESGKPKHQTDPSQILTSGDGVKFVVSSQWGSENSMNLVRFAEDQRWDIKVKC